MCLFSCVCPPLAASMKKASTSFTQKKKKTVDHHWTQTWQLVKDYFSMFQIYILFVQDGDRHSKEILKWKTLQLPTDLFLFFYTFQPIRFFLHMFNLLTKICPRHFTSFSAKKRNRDGWRRRWRRMAAAWRMIEAREEEHHRCPPWGLLPNMPSSTPSTGECNVHCVCVCVCV